MSVNAVATSLPSPLLRPQEVARPRVGQERPIPAELAPAPPVRPATGGLLAPREEALPVESPAGTDPALWQVLTREERAHFARMSGMGPLTYGRPSASIAAAEVPLGRGARLDVKA